MTKGDAIQLFGSTATEMARAIGVTRSAISQWPAELSQEQIDRVVGAAVRLGKWPCGGTDQPAAGQQQDAA